MNLFIITTQPYGAYTSTVPEWMRANSMDLPDRHVVKMILESAQIVMTALHIKAVEQYHPGAAAVLAKASHYNMPMPLTNGHRKHPVIKWAADCRDSGMNHIAFTLVNAVALCNEYTNRYKKEHAYHDALASLLLPQSIRDVALKLPDYLPLCAASAWDTKVTTTYINTTPPGINLIAALQRRNFILNKPWIATNYKRASSIPTWVQDAFHEDGYVRVAVLDSITAMIRLNKQHATFTPVAE